MVPAEGAAHAAAPAVEIPILYEDDDLLAVDKPAGMVVHPAYRHPDGTLFDAVAARQLARAEGRPCLLHRLDRDTSGVVLLAKTERARQALVRQFEQRRVRKWYLALVCGQPVDRQGEVCQRLRRDTADRRLVIVAADGQEAVTRYEVLAMDARWSLLLAEPHTGRTHQIRVHLAWLGHPIVGDVAYGGGPPNNAGSAGSPDAAWPRRQLLHAWSVSVRHPATGAPLRIQAPLPADMATLLPAEWHALCAARWREEHCSNEPDRW